MRRSITYKRYLNYKSQYLQPELEQTPYRLTEVLEKVCKKHFPEIEDRAQCMFCKSDTLAFITTPDKHPIRIQIHPILNTQKTPIEVMEHILTHEVLHLIIRPREIDGKLISHPPEFWERENELSPEKSDVWNWIYFNYNSYLKADKKAEAIFVKRRKRRKECYFPGMSYEEVQAMTGGWNGEKGACAG